MIDFNKLVALEVTSCCACGITFAAPEVLISERRKNNEPFFCPNGHELSFRENAVDRLEAKVEKLTQERDSAVRNRDIARDQCGSANRRASAHKGVATKLRKRIVGDVY